MNAPTFEIDRDLYPFTSRFMELSNGAKVHYVDEGEGEVTLLMLHGNPTWSFVYRNLITGLAPDYRCVAVDYPGFSQISRLNDALGCLNRSRAAPGPGCPQRCSLTFSRSVTVGSVVTSAFEDMAHAWVAGRRVLEAPSELT